MSEAQQPQPQPFGAGGLAAPPPPAMARKAAEVGEAKARLDLVSTFALAVLAGAFSALGAAFATTVLAGGSSLPYGVARLLGGLAFSLGLILVVCAGAELFTGNTLIVVAWASRRVAIRRVLLLWAVVYAGNFVGSIGTAGLVALGRQYTFGKGAVGDTALTIAATKTGLGWGQAVALGFEHSVAKMYFSRYALFVRADGGWLAGRSGLPDLAHLTWGRFVWANLLPVTIGNLIGGVVLVGAVYWFVYLRPRRLDPAA